MKLKLGIIDKFTITYHLGHHQLPLLASISKHQGDESAQEVQWEFQTQFPFPSCIVGYPVKKIV